MSPKSRRPGTAAEPSTNQQAACRHVGAVTSSAEKLTRSESDLKIVRTYRCPLCDTDDYLTLRRGDYAWLLKCQRCGAGKPFLRALGRKLGIDWRRLLDGPLPELGAPTVRSTRPDERPNKEQIERWALALQQTPDKYQYIQSRGLSMETIRARQLGWDVVRAAFTIPVYGPQGYVVNLVRHVPGGDPKYRALAGHPASLWPAMPDGKSVVLCAGMFDPLVANEHGLNNVVSTTCGCAFPAKLASRFEGKRVACCFDVGEEAQAELAVTKIRRAGAEAAWVVPLGLPNKGDDLGDFFHKYGLSRAELLRLIKRARP